MNKELIIKNKNEAVRLIQEYLDKCLDLNDEINLKRVNMLSYWFKDYINYIKEEIIFNPIKLKTYERGDIIQVNLGFNIGSEMGGLHYCVVIDKKNNRNSPVVTVIPLSSQKTEKINKNSISLGTEIYEKMIEKYNQLEKKSRDLIKENERLLIIQNKKLLKKNLNKKEAYKKIEIIRRNILEANKNLNIAKKVKEKTKNMKDGTIAIINQIRVVSKQRIYDPRTDFDVLAGIKLSDKNLDLIDNKMNKLFTKSKI